MKTSKQNRRSVVRMFLMITVVVMMTVASYSLLIAHEGEHGGMFAKDFSGTWERAKGYSIGMAEQMPEEHFGFKPTPEQMTFAEQLLHSATVMNFVADKLSGAEAKFNPLKAEGKSKKDIIGMLGAAFDKAAKALDSLSDEEAGKKIHVFGEGDKALHLTKKQLVLMLRDHTTHHRGQMIVYLRLKGQKPGQYVGF